MCFQKKKTVCFYKCTSKPKIMIYNINNKTKTFLKFFNKEKISSKNTNILFNNNLIYYISNFNKKKIITPFFTIKLNQKLGKLTNTKNKC